MNIFAHIIISYILAKNLGFMSLLSIAIFFGILPDFDYLFKFGQEKKIKFDMRTKSRFHELFGLLVFSVVILFASLIDKLYLFLIFPLLSHYIMDYLTRPMRPFNPFSKQSIFLEIYPRSFRKVLAADIMITLILLVIALW